MRQGNTKFNKIKFEEMLLKSVNSLLRKEFKDPRLLMMTVTRVELNPDYSSAKLYWDTFNTSDKNEIIEAVKNIAGSMRTKLARVLNVRHTPTVTFIYDSQFEDENRITELLQGK